MLLSVKSCFEKFSLLLVAADDLVEQCPGAVPESICQFVVDPKTMQQHIEKGAVTSGRGKGKNDSESHVRGPDSNWARSEILTSKSCHCNTQY